MTRKILNNADAGDATHAGGNDFDYINQYLTGVDQTGADPVTINTNTTYKNQQLRLQNPDNTFAGIINMSAITADRNITLPLESANMNLVSRNSVDVLTQKTISAKSQTSLNGILTDPLVKRWGAYQVSGQGDHTGGVFTAFVAAGTPTTAGSIDNTHAYYRNYASAASTNASAGITFGNINTPETMRKWNPYLRFKVATPSTSSQRMLMGFSSTFAPTTDTFLATTSSGVVVGYRSTDANFSVFNNDGAGGAMAVTSSGIPKDTAVRTFEIIFNDSIPNCVVTMNGSTIATITTQFPASTTGLFMWWYYETTAAAITNGRFYTMYFEDTPQ